MTVQPLVENALYHGVKEKRGQSKITITFEDAGDDIVIQVLDDGIGMTEERLQEVKEGLKQNNNVGFGLAAVQGRLVLYFGAGYGIESGNDADIDRITHYLCGDRSAGVCIKSLCITDIYPADQTDQ